ncbi:nicotinate phosphoribosyltransferase [Mycolicibacterium sphagni]|uniref:nicotinate phosphoribosyltransferase n=1 Tax=Mycolicibacterium sphagni TaxID=1786 RepID=UPI0021F2B02D|nr:nicotinate phosphoribosyltransferase [Mycolicibacterium sphagni]MCV7174907.1 nicotinate phosphoribosyltransferase [Mycolicibacterium sphagni]
MSKFAPIAALMECDAYKLDHRRQYDAAAGTGAVTRVYSNYTNRKSRIPGVNHVVHFGLQAQLHHLTEAYEPFFAAKVDTVRHLYRERVTKVLGSDAADAIGTDHIAGLHELGYLPLEFRAVPEGTLVPIKVPSFTAENTHDDFAWVTNYHETGLSAGVWQPSTSATIAHAYRVLLEKAAERTGAPREAVDWQLHDFSYRGMSSHQTAAASGAAHLLSFYGTDSLVALDWIDRYYGGDYIAGSVPATEHSVMSTGIMAGRGDTRQIAERELFKRLMDLYPTGILSVVSDTFDLFHVMTNILPSLQREILKRNGKLVVRPDSGDPVKILCGDPAGATEAERKGVIELLWDWFPGIGNEKGFRRLNPHVGDIYGDSITLARAGEITDRLEEMRFESTNATLGVGSFTYQYNTRDTFGSAMKATWAKVNGVGVDLFKDPATDDGTKRSATGRLAVLRGASGELELVERATPEQEMRSLLKPVWRNGEFIRHQDFADVRTVLAGQR